MFASLFRFNIFEPHAATCTQILSRLLDATQETRIVLETL
jgi:hypothetical protein